MSIPFSSASLRYYETDRDPTTNDDITRGHERGNWWRNSSSEINFHCLDNSQEGAVWVVKPSFFQGTFTPTLEFGGGSTGITYNTQTGNYTQIGTMVTFNIYLDLSSKGSESGNATITSLPFTNGSSPSAFVMYAQDLSHSLLYADVGARMSPSEQFVRLFETGSGLNIKNLTNISFQDDSRLFVSGSYFL